MIFFTCCTFVLVDYFIPISIFFWIKNNVLIQILWVTKLGWKFRVFKSIKVRYQQIRRTKIGQIHIFPREWLNDINKENTNTLGQKNMENNVVFCEKYNNKLSIILTTTTTTKYWMNIHISNESVPGARFPLSE